jgi:RHS repeat-associated protein
MPEGLRKAVSALLVWAMVMFTLPEALAQQPQRPSSDEWTTDVTYLKPLPLTKSTLRANPQSATTTTTTKTASSRPQTHARPDGLDASQTAVALLAQANTLSASAGLSSLDSQGMPAGTHRLSTEEVKHLGDMFHTPAAEAKETSTSSAAGEVRGGAEERLLARNEKPEFGFITGAAGAAASVAEPLGALPFSSETKKPDLDGLKSLLRPYSPLRPLFQGGQIAGLAVFVGYADDVRANPNFPVPWKGAPNTTFIGNGPSFDSGAIRLDNNSSTPIQVDDVFVTVPGWTTSDHNDAHGNGIADLWGSFTIAPNSTVILAQTTEFNLDTSDFGVRGCGDTLANGQAPIPTVKITINGVATTFSDTGHVLDTGGFDLACRGNESLQWRLIGTSGIENQAGHVTLAPATSIQPVGVTYTATATVTDAGGQPTPNATVDFVVLSGPNAGKTGTGTTDAQGNATFSYSSVLLGTDILQASVPNATGGAIQSEQVTTTWTTADPCPTPTTPPPPSQTVLIYTGPGTGEFNDPLTLSVQLTDANGVPLAGRSLTLGFASQTFLATTDNNGIATVNIPAAPAPGSIPLTAAFAGETNFQPAQMTANITIGREETAILYTGSTLLGTVVPQQVSAVLTDPASGVPIANETVTFRVGSVQAQAVTNAQGVATTTMILGVDQTSGPTAIQVSFAGDTQYKPSLTGTQVTVYLSTSFVVWGGNQGGVHLGQDVNFWGHSWTDQVISGNFTANPSFKGFADPVNQVHVCEASAGSGGPLDDQCWHSKPGNSFPPPVTVPAFIEVIISTAITKHGSEIFGNIAAAAVCQVDPTPVYGPDPGKPGFCKLVAVVEDGANVFPQAPALTATQSQPPTVLPGQTFNVTAQITNSSSATASSVTVNENFDGLTPATGTQSFASILSGAQQTATFQVSSPVVPIRGSSETSLAYQQRLAASDGRIFTSTGTITFTDAFGQQFLPITVSSSSRLRLPELRVGITGPSCVGPGSKIPYKVTVNNVGTAEADNVTVLLNMPDGTNATATIASIASGGSVTVTVNLVAPVISAKQPNETDDQYRARLAAIDGSDLIAVAKVNWQDQQGNNYGQIEQKIVTTVERVPIMTVTPQGPATLLPGQKATLNLSVQNIGGGNSSQVVLQVTNPDGSVVNIPAFALQAGQANTVSSTFTVPGAAKAAGESDAAYQARLAALDNSSLNFTTQLRWFDAAANPYGPTSAGTQTTEILPVLSASLTGPATTFSTNNINYSLRLANLGHADASTFSVIVQLPDGSTVNPFPASPLVAGSAAQISIPFGIPQAQPSGALTAMALLKWTDAAANAYGPQSPAVVSANTDLDLPMVSAGPNQSITTPSTTLNGSATDTALPPGTTLVSSWSQVSGPAPATFSSGSSPVTQITFTTDGTYVVQLTASVTNTSLPLTSSARATIVVNAPTGGGGGGGGGGTIVNQVLQGQIGQPLVGTVVQGQVAITVAAGTTLTGGVLDFWPVSNPANVQVLNANTTGSGTIGIFDGTTLQNGQYVVRLTTTLADGTSQASLIFLNVIGENKLGRFTKTVTDMRVPVAGMAITINRTYDSLKREQVSDFGFGWALATSVDVSVDASNNVSFTFNGRRVTFFFAPQPAGFPFSFLLTPTYTPQPNLHGTLTSDGCGLFVSSALTCFPGPGTYQPTTFTYTDPYGRVYIFGADGQLKSVKDLNGNILTFTPAGISSSAGGISVAFIRDGQGRITQITDPNGNSRSYVYDTPGDLTTVNKPGLAAPVTYGYTADHLLIRETDPRGNTASSTYFPDGRLQSTTDALGNLTQFAYDTTNNIITTTNPDGGVTIRTNNSFGKMVSYQDPLGDVTTFGYDANQNITSVTNALGKTYTYTYDAKGNVTSAKDPLGNTLSKTYDDIGRMTQATDPVGQVTQFQYDNRGNLTSLNDAIGTLGTVTYDSTGNRTSFSLPNGAVAKFSYDSFGNPVSVTDHRGFTSNRQFDSLGQWIGMTDPQHGSMAMKYDDLGNYAQRRDPLGNTLSYVYDADGNRAGETDHNGNTYSHAYDAANNETRTTFPDGTSISATYDFAHRPLTRTNESGRTTRFVYDKAGRLTSLTEGDGTPDASTITLTYDAIGRATKVVDANGNPINVTYDDADRVTSIQDALGRTSTNAYDADSRVTSSTKPNGATTSMTYDARGRITTTTNADGTTVKRQYGPTTLSSETDEAGKTTSYAFDSAGQIASYTDALGNTTKYTRDAVGNLTGVTDGNGHTTSYQYNAADRLVKKVLPDGSFEQYTYDPNGNVTAARLTDGHVTQYTYDNRDRVTQINYFDGQVVSFTFTPSGKRQTATTGPGTTRYDYDGQDRLIKVTQPDGSAISYSYDASNNITSIVTAGGTASYSYDALNRLIGVTDVLGGVTTYSYDLGGRLTQRTLPNGVVTNYTYDLLDRLTSVTQSLGSAPPFESFVYTLNPSGKRLSVVEIDGRKTNWTYDDDYRLIRETVTSGGGTILSDVSFTYDAVGNRTSLSSNGATITYNYNATDQLTSYASVTLSYDARGNLAQVNDPATDVTSYTYDGANRLISASHASAGTTAAYTYDADGRWVSRTVGGTVRKYLWNEISQFGDVVLERDGSGATAATYTLGWNDLIQETGNGNSTASYYLHDALGNVDGLTNPAGAETDRYRFDAFGQRTVSQGSTINPYAYRSQRTDEFTGLLYLRARYMDTTVGRFTARDTAPFQLEEPIDLNRYTYAAANPINNYDPTGYTAAEEYGIVSERETENAMIEGYLAGRRSEAYWNCLRDWLQAFLVVQALGILVRPFLAGRRSPYTIAFGHLVDAPLDAPGKDYMFSPADPVGRRVLLAKAAAFKAAGREDPFAVNGSPEQAVLAILESITGLFLGLDFNLADRCENHAELKILRYASPPLKTILSIGVSRPICVNCHIQLYPVVDCLVPFGTNTRCLNARGLPLIGR